jgi:hypothetical protein
MMRGKLVRRRKGQIQLTVETLEPLVFPGQTPGKRSAFWATWPVSRGRLEIVD